MFPMYCTVISYPIEQMKCNKELRITAIPEHDGPCLRLLKVRTLLTFELSQSELSGLISLSHVAILGVL